MPNILTDTLTAFVSGSVSAIDGRPYGVQANVLSATLGTAAEMFMKIFNRVLTPSACLASGGSAGAVLIQAPTSVGLSATVAVWYHGAPYHLMSATAISGQPPSATVATTSAQIRKVLVGITVSAPPLASSPSSNAGAAMVFVVGSAFATSGGAVTSGGQSAYFNSVGLPKPSAGMIPFGWLNIPNSFAASAGIADHMMITDWRATQGMDLSAVMGNVIWQP